MLPISAGVEPATSWTPVGRRIKVLRYWTTGHKATNLVYNSSQVTAGSEQDHVTKTDTRREVYSFLQKIILVIMFKERQLQFKSLVWFGILNILEQKAN